ncbi:nucleotidyltransferase domain-containing protein [uncultured Amphritea sp.]|uniref:nucleotidyltransferase family protein n=1 Tax=uncultured Amphritea sp. TaxID=981605 RepID=UPI002608E7EA|nr:nucleotidyltransferase domain-containing protein [uncultured Amphritea sp.]
MLDLSDGQLAEVQAILAKNLAQKSEVYAFGSRTKQTARKYSDLDLLIKTADPIDYGSLSLLEEAFSESDLPFKTDLVDWNRVSEEFQDHIKPQLVRIL